MNKSTAIFYVILASLLLGCENPANDSPSAPPTVKTNLASLTVGSPDSVLPLSPEFSADTQEYTVLAPNDITQITISASAADPEASISITPAQPAALTPGANIFTITVSAGGSVKTYKITAIHTTDADKDITGFSFANPAATGFVSGLEVSVTVPTGTSLASLTPAIVHSGASISPASGTPQNFTDPVVYTVTAIDGSTKNYTVTVTVGELLTLSNTGTYAVDLMVYSGIYSETESKRVVKTSVALKAGQTGAAWNSGDVAGRNIWIKKTSGPDTGDIFYLTCSGKLALFKLEPNIQYSLNFKTDYQYLGPQYTITYEGKKTPLDWDPSVISATVPFGSFTSLKSGNLSGVKVNLLDSPDWSIDPNGAYVVNSLLSSTDNFIYGVIRLVYTGTGPRSFVKVMMRIRNSENSIRYFDYTYIDGSTLILPTGTKTNTCVSQNGEIVRIKLIENIFEDGLQFSDIEAIDLVITSASADGYAAQGDGLKVTGAATEETYSFYWPVKNDENLPITCYTTTCIYKDSGNREYFWDFPAFYVFDAASSTWKYSSDPLQPLAEARLYAHKNYSQFFTESYTPILNLSWEKVAPAASPSARSILTASLPGSMKSPTRTPEQIRALSLERRAAIDNLSGQPEGQILSTR